VAKLEDQLRNLRIQLDRRREKRQELIDLQMKLIENEAEGLGFFVPPGGPGPVNDLTGTAPPTWYRSEEGSAVPPPNRPPGSSPVPPPPSGGPGRERGPTPPPGNRQPSGPVDSLLGPVNAPIPYPPSAGAATEVPKV
jgi:hypothetical protein